MRHGRVRRHRRPHHAQAGSGALQPGKGAACCPRNSRSSVSPSTISAWKTSARKPLASCRLKTTAPRLGTASSNPFTTSAATSATRPPTRSWRAALAEIDEQHGTGQNYLFYLATSPKFFCEIVQHLGQSGLSKQEDGHWRRVVIEKPFGQDLESAMALNQNIKAVLSENQIYRIDHYLGKETVQNIMVFRFGNGIFEPIWNRRYIDHVAITNAETVGVEMRGGYFDAAGTLRDMVPNHMMQLISLTAMEPPASFSADAVRDEQAKVLQCHPAAELGRRAAPGGPRAVRRRHDAEGKGAGLPLRAWRLAGIEDRNLRRHEAEHRQLAMGRRSLLPAHRKAHGQAAHRDQHSVQARAVSAVPANCGPSTPDQPAGHSNPARRRHGARLWRQDPGPLNCAWDRSR